METNEQPMAPSLWSRFAVNVPVAILISAAMVSGSILYVGGSRSATVALPDQQKDDAAVKVKDPSTLFGPNDPMLGNPKAKVTIVEFSDFQCPYCRTFFEDTYGKLKKEYIDTGKVRLVFRNFPLSFHSMAKPAALAAQCAQEQNKFWQYHDALFVEQAKKGQGTISFSATDLKTWAQGIGLNIQQFSQCLDSQKYSAKIDADIAAAGTAGVNGTPSFFINGQLLVGAQPYSEFKALIDDAL